MYDTVVLVTDALSPEQWKAIEEQCQARYGVNAGTGEVDYLHFTVSLNVPETACPVRLTIRTARWIVFPGEKAPRKVDGLKSLRIECSLTRLYQGHTVYGGPSQIWGACLHLVSRVADVLQAELPPLDCWKASRIDVAYSYNMGCEEAVRSWIRGQSLRTHPRRVVHFWGDSGFSAEGSVHTIRAYAKGEKFDSEGGMKGLLMCRPYEEALTVRQIARNVLRCEVQWDCKDDMPMTDLFDIDLVSVYDHEWALFMGSSEQREDYRSAASVWDCLSNHLGEHALRYYQTWCVLAVRGEGWYKEHVTRKTWYAYRNMFRKLHVGWNGTDVLALSANQAGPLFIPTHSDARILA